MSPPDDDRSIEEFGGEIPAEFADVGDDPVESSKDPDEDAGEAATDARDKAEDDDDALTDEELDA